MDTISVSIYSIYLLSIFFAIFPNFLLNQKIFFLFWFLIIFCFSIVTRTFLEYEYVSDLQGYINIIEKNKIFFCSSIYECKDIYFSYYTREIVFWGTLKLLYFISNNIYFTLVIFDLIISVLIYASVSQLQSFSNNNFNIKNKQGYNYLRFLLIVLFPFLFGMQVVLRQYFAMALGLLAFTYLINSKRIKGSLFFILSCLSHNAAIVLLPFLYLFKNSILRRIFIFVSIVFVIYGVMNFADNRHGLDLGSLRSFIMLSFIYITATLIVFLLFVQKINIEFFYQYILEFYISLIILTSTLYFLIPGNQFDRVSYFIFPSMLLLISFINETLLKYKTILRIFIIIVMIIFLFLYHPGIIF
tara:strand:- start:4907 stop:5980 length:1074 start_codon:yes stop_codon:yes gene_type:complete